jgi:hypothetical protein
MRWIRGFAAVAALLALPAAAASADVEGGGGEAPQEAKDGPGTQETPAPGKRTLEEVIEDLEDRLREVEKGLEAARRPKATVKLIDISLDGLFTAGGSTATEPEILTLQGGGHDPHKRGFTAANIELSASGAVDPYLTAEGHIVFSIDPDGETGVELEEMFLTTTSLPAGLQVKAGQFFTEFGRLNPTHPHTWEFVDQPVVSTRMFGGDGMRGPGARVSWLAPQPFPVELIAGVQNANGETMSSFMGAPGDPQVGGHPWVSQDVRSPADLVYLGRAAATFDLSQTTVLLPGASGVFGPNGTRGRTSILGADLTLKWKPLANDAGFPFVTWQSEYMARRFDADGAVDPVTTTFVPGDVLHDSGAYSQVVWGFRRGWTAGARYDRAEGRGGGAGSDPARDLRTREAVDLTYYPSEFSKFRLQVNRDRSESLGGPEWSVWLQFEVLIGAHGAHKF